MPVGTGDGRYYETEADALLGHESPVSPGQRLEDSFSQFSKGQQDNFETKLTPEEETGFQQWKKQNAPNDSGFDYDLRGAYKDNLTPDPETAHWPDLYKKPNHPTFSDQSMYAKDRPDLAGTWLGDTYVPPGGAFPMFNQRGPR